MDATAAGAEIYRLPEECVAYAISLTTPGDACHSSAVSPAFRAAADSDAVWARFLPPDHAAVLARADEPAALGMSKKELFSRLCDNPVLLDDATMATVAVVVSSSGSTTSTTTEHAICLQHMQGEEEVAMHRRKQQYMRLRKGYGGRKMVVTREADPDIRCPRRRGDGWAEVELGEFVVAGDGEDDGGVVEVRLAEVDSRRWKRGLIVQGIEIKPRHSSC
ncbi:hypothetical protein HU200_041629 [Digitaria exilis]|uniref:Uncharacterized protein n=1 Tax=Digitaria exilis TaxID=1010633 RepID=A0A835B6A0_9POAL|nr:hypothetical protein HU200_041629 [Digitaria exilis]